jgi:hypothetical protein
MLAAYNRVTSSGRSIESITYSLAVDGLNVPLKRYFLNIHDLADKQISQTLAAQGFPGIQTRIDELELTINIFHTRSCIPIFARRDARILLECTDKGNGVRITYF